MRGGERERRQLEAFLSERSGRVARVGGLRRLPGGASRETWRLDLVLGAGPDAESLELVLRLDPGLLQGLAPLMAGTAGEAGLLGYLHSQGVAVPRVYWACDDPELLGGPFYLMEWIAGETIPRRILRDEALAPARAQLARQLGRELARIHGIDPGCPELGDLPRPGSGQTALDVQLGQLHAGLEQSPHAIPVLELAVRWLERSAAPEAPRVLVHGDYRMGNVMVGPEGLRTILDWELAHIGDPYEDLAWMCAKTWRFGELEHPVGGVGQREDFYRAYEAERGGELERARLRYWEVLALSRVAIVWIFQLRAYLGGARASVEHAAIGRRLAETEFDLLELLEGA